MKQTHVVTGIHKAISVDRSHYHVNCVCTSTGEHFSRQEVVESILLGGDTWKTETDKLEGSIVATVLCPHAGCRMSPYLTLDAETMGEGAAGLEQLRPGCRA